MGNTLKYRCRPLADDWNWILAHVDNPEAFQSQGINCDDEGISHFGSSCARGANNLANADGSFAGMGILGSTVKGEYDLAAGCRGEGVKYFNGCGKIDYTEVMGKHLIYSGTDIIGSDNAATVQAWGNAHADDQFVGESIYHEQPYCFVQSVITSLNGVAHDVCMSGQWSNMHISWMEGDATNPTQMTFSTAAGNVFSTSGASPLGFWALLSRLPDGSEIVSAKCFVTINNVKYAYNTSSTIIVDHHEASGGETSDASYVPSGLEVFAAYATDFDYPAGTYNLPNAYLYQSIGGVAGGEWKNTYYTYNYATMEQIQVTQFVADLAPICNNILSLRHAARFAGLCYTPTIESNAMNVATGRGSMKGLVAQDIPVTQFGTYLDSSNNLCYYIPLKWNRFMMWDSAELGNCFFEVRYPDGQLQRHFVNTHEFPMF